MMTSRHIVKLVLYTNEGKKEYEIGNVNDVVELLRLNRVPFKVETEITLLPYVSMTIQSTIQSMQTIFLFVMFYFIYRERMKMNSLLKGKKNFKFIQDEIKVRFADVAGADEAKLEIQEYVDFLKNAHKFSKIGAKMPKGALLSGPPGTGKTLLAKACAGEAGVPFFALSGSELVELFVGVGARKVRNLFQEAISKAPSIVFIDEIDAIGKKRGGFSSEEKDKTLNQILVELDGFKPTTNVIVFAATNIPESLDEALTRSGRFDRTIQLTLPDKRGRAAILRVHLQNRKIKPNSLEETIDFLSGLTAGFSGADLENLCNEAALIAVRRNHDYILDEDFESASERVMAGIESTTPFSDKVKKRISVHESGKAIASFYLGTVPPVIKMSIVPRAKKKTGFSQYLTSDPKLQNVQQLIEHLAFMVSGKVAEELVFGESSSASENELEKAYGTARRFVEKFGMAEALSNIAPKIESQHTAKVIDEEVILLLNKAAAIAKIILESRIEILNALSQRLLFQETLKHKEIVEVIGEKPYQASDEYKKYQQDTEIKAQSQVASN